MVIEYPLYRAAATLGSLTTFTGLPIPCCGASVVSFHISASNTVLPASYSIHVRKAARGGLAEGPWRTVVAGTGGAVEVTLSASALNAGGQVNHLAGLAPTNSLPDSVIGWDEARMVVVGNSLSAITALAVRAQAIFPGPGGPAVDLSLTS